MLRAALSAFKIKMIILNDFGAQALEIKSPLQIKETVLKILIFGAICPYQQLMNYINLR